MGMSGPHNDGKNIDYTFRIGFLITSVTMAVVVVATVVVVKIGSFAPDV